jgi:hypothetical protein
MRSRIGHADRLDASISAASAAISGGTSRRRTPACRAPSAIAEAPRIGRSAPVSDSSPQSA